MEYTSDAIQQISFDFRNVARRLLNTDIYQCDANLKRFMSFIEQDELIMNFIADQNTCIHLIPQIVASREWLHPFEISHVVSEEISFEYQLLRYAVDARNGDFTSVYGSHYISPKATLNDSAQDFIKHIIDPFVDYIADFLKKQYDDAVKRENVGSTGIPGVLTANNSTLVFNSSVAGHVTNQVVIGSDIRLAADSIISQIEQSLSDKNYSTDVHEIKALLVEIKEQIAKGQRPKRGVLTAFKTLCSGLVAIAPLAEKLWELLV